MFTSFTFFCRILLARIRSYAKCDNNIMNIPSVRLSAPKKTSGHKPPHQQQVFCGQRVFTLRTTSDDVVRCCPVSL